MLLVEVGRSRTSKRVRMSKRELMSGTALRSFKAAMEAPITEMLARQMPVAKVAHIRSRC